MVLTASQIAPRVKASAQLTSEGGLWKLSFQAMATPCKVHFRAESPGRAKDFAGAALDWVAQFEAKYSRFIPDSLIGRINAAAGKEWIGIDTETSRIFKLCDDLHFMTRGAFDPSSLPLLKLWNWREQQVPSGEAIAEALRLVGWRKLQRRPDAVFLPQAGMGIDLGGIGKEYAVDRVSQLAAEHGIAHSLVDFGHDIKVTGLPPDKPLWHIGLEDPAQPGKCWCGLGVTNKAVATSGDYLRQFTRDGKRYGHIIDPRTGWPVANGCSAVSVIAPSCSQAGALSTSVFILGPAEGLKLVQSSLGCEAAVTVSGNRMTSPRFYEYVAS